MTDGPQQRPLFALVIRLGAALVLSLMLVFVKLLGESGVHLLEILFWRQVVTIPLLAGWFYFSGRMLLLKTDRMALHGKRAAYGIVGMVLNFGGVLLLPLAEATTFGFTSAIWAVILSAILLREQVGPYRWAAVILGFAGVVIIAQPGGGDIRLYGALVAIGAAFMIALISIQIRDLGKTEHPLTIVFYFSAFTTPILALAMPFVAQQHTPYQWSLLAGLALFGILGQFLLTAALRVGTVSTVIVMDYSAIIWATLFGWAVFEHLPPASTWIGAPLIIAAGVTIAWREHFLTRKRRTELEARQMLPD
ncbi:DMT family transporter [Allopontixanthobacter sediminis]|uniref:EamA family transporter n=1 Tax=Allopontixanthobacter sediminis TaxID=1689985 RepID=A0A845B758_9SPHN|nr:DMT family transporter [Allopontixanthobacter sediminis]MXP45302.1 EamA family transporter [Allopontixanthobacter sediminis]